MENLRYLLYQHNPKVALLLGHRYAANPPEYRETQETEKEEGYMAG